MIARASSHVKDGFNPNVIPLIPSPNMGNLQRIISNVHLPILLRLLLCKGAETVHNPDDCPYPEHKNSRADKKICRDSSDAKLAQVYVRHEQIDKKARSCVLVFVQRYCLSSTDALFHILKNTVDWLQIAREKPCFYIFHYGQPESSLITNDAVKKLNKKIKETFTGYPREEDVCMGVSVIRNSESLQINHTGKFSFGIA
jgi:hypothetical protein